ncbi:MAG TPA: alpha/beta hydrolase [Kofleriaceae bacterium]|nr:alpha/beta hydrolase [Kofleriaceae bacterium]
MEWTLEYAQGRAMMVRRFGTGPELVWIHGLGEWSVSFHPVVAHPALAGFRHTLVDLPGYGRSPWPDEPDDLEQLADRLAAWLADHHARTGSRPVVIGHSMGGVLATLLGERDVARAVIDIDGNLSPGDCNFSARAAAYTYDDFVAHGFATMHDQVFGGGVLQPATRTYYGAMCVASPRMYHHHAGQLVALSAPENLASRLAKLAVPALFIAGVPDGICARSRELLTAHGVRWVGVEPAGHWVYLDQLDGFVQAVTSFLAEQA